MKSLLIVVAVVLAVISGYSQNQKTKEEQDREKEFQDKAAKATADSSKQFGWAHSVVTGINMTQVSFKDWSQGGENALSYTLWLKGQSEQKTEVTDWVNAYKVAFGQTRLSSQGLRKTDDEIYFQSLFIYKLGTVINPYCAVTLRTQIARGYDYAVGADSAISKFFDPAYLTQSAGVAYKPITELTTRIGVGMREVITSDFTHYADDPTTPEIEKTKIQGGFESVTDVSFTLAENIQYTGRLEIFGPFKKMDRALWRSDHTLSAKVNKYVTANFDVQFINDVDVSPYTQIKEALAIGLSYTLL